MKSSARDISEGTFHKAKGKIKEIGGKLSHNPNLEAEGTGEKTAGKVQKKIGQVKKVFGK
jgi:uncharacterized protein YjbJ (UPF0337 family)